MDPKLKPFELTMDLEESDIIKITQDKSIQESKEHIMIQNEYDTKSLNETEKSGSNLVSENSSNIVSKEESGFTQKLNDASIKSIDFMKSNMVDSGIISKSISPRNNEGRNRITFGPKANLNFKKNIDNDNRINRSSKFGAGENSILSFKNFSIKSKVDSIRNSKIKKTTKKKAHKKKRSKKISKGDLLKDSLLSRSSDRTQKKFNSSNKTNKEMQGDDNEKKKTQFKKKPNDFKMNNDNILSESWTQSEQGLRESRDTIKKNKEKANNTKGKRKKKERKVVEKNSGIKIIKRK
jgi:hypothetical protein